MPISHFRNSLIWLIIIICIEGICPLAQAANLSGELSYFETGITQTQTVESAQEYFKTSNLKLYTLKSISEIQRFEKTQQFLTQVKKEASKRYASGVMSTYELQDFSREIGYLTHNMNEYFKNQSDYERTRNRTYRALARQNLNDANMTYVRLSAITFENSRK